MENKKGLACQDEGKLNPPLKNREESSQVEKVSPIPEWNEHIQKVVVGYH